MDNSKTGFVFGAIALFLVLVVTALFFISARSMGIDTMKSQYYMIKADMISEGNWTQEIENSPEVQRIENYK